MANKRPFTLIAAIIFAAMALAHLDRLATGFPVTVGTMDVPLWVSWVALAVTLFLSVMLYRESRR